MIAKIYELEENVKCIYNAYKRWGLYVELQIEIREGEREGGRERERERN
jgi:hypothetical protein